MVRVRADVEHFRLSDGIPNNLGNNYLVRFSLNCSTHRLHHPRGRRECHKER